MKRVRSRRRKALAGVNLEEGEGGGVREEASRERRRAEEAAEESREEGGGGERREVRHVGGRLKNRAEKGKEWAQYE